MKTAFLAALLCLPVINAQSVDADFETLKKRRNQAVQDAMAPIEKKFKETANQLLGKAIQTGDMATAEKIKKELLILESKKGIEEIRKTLVFYSWASKDFVLNFEEDGRAKTSFNSAAYEIRADGTVSMTWNTGETTTITPSKDLAVLVEKGGGNYTFTKIPKGSKPPGSVR